MNEQSIQNELSNNGVTFLLASLITSYPDDYAVGCVTQLLGDGVSTGGPAFQGEKWDALESQLRALTQNADMLSQVRSDYIQLFDHSRSENPLYETEYGRARTAVKGNSLADVAGFYRAFGLLQSDDGATKEMPDHVAVEFEFYSYMLFKEQAVRQLGDNQGIDIVSDGRKKFLADHLGRFVSSIAQRPAVAQNVFYSGVFNWCAQVVKDECARNGIEPEPAAFVEESAKLDNISCGAGSKETVL